MPRQTSLQVTEATERQMDDLKAAGFGTTTDIIRLAIDRMHREEINMKQYQIGTIIKVPHPYENAMIQAEIIGHWTDKINHEAGITVVDAGRKLSPWQISYGYL